MGPFFFGGRSIVRADERAAHPRALTDDRAWGPDGYLADHGLIPMPAAERTKVREQARALTPLALWRLPYSGTKGGIKPLGGSASPAVIKP